MKPKPRIVPLLSAVSLLLLAVLWFWPQSSIPPKSVAGKISEQPMAAAAEVSAPTNPDLVEEPTAKAVISPGEELTAAEPMAQPDLATLAAFDGWIGDWQAASPEARAQMTGEGARLAAERRPEFKALIVSNPRLALERSVPRVIRQDLPAEIVAQLEKPISAKGEYKVAWKCGDHSDVEHSCHAERAFVVGGMTYKASVVSGLMGLPPQENVPFQGVAVDSELAVAANPVRRLETGEQIPAGTPIDETCLISGKTSETVGAGESATEVTPTVEIAGQLITLSEPAHVSMFEKQYSYEGGWGSGSVTFYNGLKPATNWGARTGIFRWLYIPVIYEGDLSHPITREQAEKDVADAARFWAEGSFGKLKVLGTVTPPVKLPFSKAASEGYNLRNVPGGVYYDGGEMLHYAAQEEARKMGYDPDSYSGIVVQTGFGGGGVAWGGRKAVINGPGMGIILHELGHVLGLNHAEARFTAGDLPHDWALQPDKGSPFDIMGRNFQGRFGMHYHSMAKQRLGWLGTESILTPAGASGNYRIHAIDQPRLEDGKSYALRAAKDADTAYVIEYRAHTDALGRQTTVLIDRPGWGLSPLLDTTPDTLPDEYEDFKDAGLTPGRTYSDLEADMHFTVLAENETTPPSIDVAYRKGPFPGNTAPVVNLAASAVVVNAGGTVNFNANANDVDGDALAYHWDFGDGLPTANSAVVSRTFPVAAQVNAMVAVSDMKGGLTRRHVVINVGAHGRQLVTGTINVGGQPLANVRVTSSDGRYAFTDASGNYALAGVGSGSRTLAANLRGYTFAPVFTSPLNVGAGVNTANWTATGDTFVSLSKTADATEGGANGSFTLSRTGATTTDLLVRVAKPNGTAASDDFTVNPANGVDPLQTAYWTFTIPSGQASRVVSVAAVNDTATEGDEVIRFQLGAGAGYETIVASTAEIVIFDNEAASPKVAVIATDAAAAEPSDSASFTFFRGGSTALALSLNITWSSTATNGGDYTLMPSPVVIPAGQSSVTVPVAVINDSDAEATERIIATVASGAGYLPDTAASSALVTLLDDDTAIVTVEAADDRASEAGSDSGIFLIHRSGSVTSELRVSYTLTGSALEGTDYEALTGQVLIAAGAASAPVVIAPQDDATGERPESVILTLTSPGGPYQVGADFQTTLFIDDDGDLPSVRARRVSDGAEGGSASFALRAMGSAPGNLAVSYALGGTATSGSDYNHSPAVVQVPADGSEVLVSIPITNDPTAESTETLVVTIATSASYEVMDDSVTMAVYDNDSGASRVSVCRQYPSPLFGANRLNPIRESDPLGSFYFYRATSAGAITVNYAVSGSATAGMDFNGLPGSVVIPDGSFGATVEFVPVDDPDVEGIETVIVTILPGIGYGLDLAPSAAQEILDNEATVTVGFQLAQSTASESGGGFHDVAVTLSAASTASVNVRCVGGSGSSAVGNGVDWSFVDAANGNAVLPTASLSFPAGVTSRNVRIKVIDDGLAEPAESLVLELQSPDRSTLSTTATTHRILITDDGLNGLVKEERWNSTAVYDNNTWGTVVPAFTGYLAGFTPSQEAGEVYSRRLSGLIVAPASGQFTFWVAADDTARLFLSSTTLPANKFQIASVGGYTGFQNWTQQPNQTSLPITLVAGQSYYMEVQHKETGGGDHVSVAWQGPGFSRIPLALDYVAPAPPTAVRFVTTESVSREGDGATARVLVALDRPVIGSPVSVDYTVSGTATAGIDFTLAPGTLVFAVGEQVKRLPLSIIANATVEAPEAILISLSNPGGAALASPSNHLVTLLDANIPIIETLFTAASSTMGSGTALGNVMATPAPGRNIAGWTILAGNTANAFAVNSAGQITLVTPAALPNPGGVQLVIRATDDGGATGDGLVNIVCNAPANGVVEQRWNGRSAFDSDFRWASTASHTGTLATFTTAQNVGNDYSRRLTGYLKPTVSGDYTFWIAGDDECRLYLSSDGSPTSKSQIASVGGWTNFQAWDATQGQKSRVIPLVAGKVYWMEVHHLEESGGDHVSVAWQRAGGAREVIPAAVIFPYVAGVDFDNPPVPPTIALTSPASGSVFDTGASVILTADIAGGTLAVTAVEFYRGATLIGSDASAPYAVTWANAIAGNHALTARAVFAGGGVTSSTVSISVVNPDPAGDSDGDGFTTGLELALGTNPYTSASQPPALYANLRAWWKFDETTGLTADDSTGRLQDGAVTSATWTSGAIGNALDFNGVNQGVLIGNSAALNGTGDFTLSAWVKVPQDSSGGVIIRQSDPGASGDQGVYVMEVNPDGTVNFSVTGSVGDQFNLGTVASIKDNDWHFLAAVRSGTTGTIYIDGVSAANGSGTLQSLTSRAVAIGYDPRSGNQRFKGLIDDVRIYERALPPMGIDELYKTPIFDGGSLTMDASENIAFKGNLRVSNAFIAAPLTFIKLSGPPWLSVAPDGKLLGTPALGNVGLNIIRVRVNGSGGYSAEANVAITVNAAPRFTTTEIEMAAAVSGSAYAGTLVGRATDLENNVMSFSKLSGPDWLTVGLDGSLAGTPQGLNVGANLFVVRVTDVYGASSVGLVTIRVGYGNAYPPNNYGALLGTNTSDEFIQRVRIADLDNTSGNNGGFANFQALVASMNPGQVVSYTLTPAWTGTIYNEAWTVWIDLNRDGDFGDTDERVLTLAGSKTERTGTFVIPANASLGMSRMRVAMKYDTGVTNPTGSFTYGEVEDYSVQIAPLQQPNAAPYFLVDPVLVSYPRVGGGPAPSLAARAADWENHPLTFSKISGPAWLQVSPAGELSGAFPSGGATTAEFTVAVTDSLGGSDTTTLRIRLDDEDFNSWMMSKGLVGAAAGFEMDPDGDGLANGVEFVLGGEPNPANPGSNSAGLLPKPTMVGGNLVFTFSRKDVSEVSVGLIFQWSSNLVFPLSSNDIPVGPMDSTTDGISVDVTEDNSDADTIVITIPAAKAINGKLFGRLKTQKGS